MTELGEHTSEAPALDGPVPLDELKELVRLHAGAQGGSAADCAALLARVVREDGRGPGSWVGEWGARARALDMAGDPLGASAAWNLARFPHVDSPERATAHTRSVDAFARWAALVPGARRIEVPYAGSSFGVWTAALRPDRPLLVIVGGIVSTKEQWGGFLPLARRLGFAVAVTELPGVGENPLRYDADSAGLYPALLDRLAGRADVDRSHLLAFSFGGHLALRAAGTEPRIRSVATVGAPVSALFQDRDWWSALPRTTTRTLAALARVPERELFGYVHDWALTVEELRAVRVPVSYVASRRDEIVPPADPRLLARHLSD